MGSFPLALNGCEGFVCSRKSTVLLGKNVSPGASQTIGANFRAALSAGKVKIIHLSGDF